MSWDAAIFGTLHVPPAQFKSFLARSAEASAVPNVEKYLSLFEVTGDPVKKVLATLDDEQSDTPREGTAS